MCTFDVDFDDFFSGRRAGMGVWGGLMNTVSHSQTFAGGYNSWPGT